MKNRLHRIWLLLPLLLIAFAPGLRAGPHLISSGESDLPVDPALRYGTLDNGMHYVVMQNHKPKGRVAIRLLVKAGSFMEQENQRGLAHFLEHMAFNGTTNYPPDTLIKFFQRLGMNFGGDTNAYTSFDHTVYMLDLPNTKPEVLDEGFQVLADYAGGMLLIEEEIDAERGIILSEKRTRDNVGFRTFVNEAKLVYADTRIPTRIPIGQADIIAQAPRDRFLDFYNTWYRPELMTVIAVGDVDPDTLVATIKAKLGAITARGPSQPAPDLGQVEAFTGLRTNYHSEPEAGSTTITLETVINHPSEPDTSAQRLKELSRDLAISMLNRRLSILAKKEGSGFTHARASAGQTFNFLHEASISVTCEPDQWQNAVQVAEQELRRALEHGFQKAELKEATANYLNALQQAVKTAPTRQSAALTSGIIGSIMNRKVFTSPEENLALLGPALASATPEACTAALREAWGNSGRYLLVSGNVKIDGDAAAKIAHTYQQAHQEPVDAPAKIADLSFAYTDFGPAGKVAERHQIEDLGITLVTFANGVRLNMKATDFEANRIQINIRVGSGKLTEPEDERGLAYAASATFTAGGLGKHSADNLRRLMAGHTVGVGFGVDDEALQFSGVSNRDDLLLEFQLATAYITDPGYRPEAMRQFHKGVERMYNSFAHTANGALSTEVPHLLAGGDSRFGLPSEEGLLSRSTDEIRAWLAPQLKHGPIEVAVVGDFDTDAVIDAVAHTLGALPDRDPPSDLDVLRVVPVPTEPLDLHYTFESEIPKGVVALFWPTTDARNVHVVRRLNLLGSVFTDRLRVKVREEIGGAYSPSAGNSSSLSYHDYGWMRTFITVDPHKAGEIADVTVALAAELAAKGVTTDELERAKKPILTSLRQSVRTNSYWLGSVLSRAQSHPEVLDWARSRSTDYKSITTEDLDALAKRYLQGDRVFRVTVLPKSE